MSSQEQSTEPIIDLTAWGPERRGSLRYLCRHRHLCKILVRPSFQSLQGIVHDVSAAGLGLLLPNRLEPGSVLAIQLPRLRTGMSHIQSARVVHVQRHPTGDWLVGCALNRPLSEDDLAVFV